MSQIYGLSKRGRNYRITTVSKRGGTIIHSRNLYSFPTLTPSRHFSKRAKLSPAITRVHVKFDYERVWKPLLTEYYKKGITDEWKHQYTFLIDYLKEHHASEVRYQGGYPGRRTFEDKLKQYRQQYHLLSINEFNEIQKRYPRSSVIHHCNYTQVKLDESNCPWVIFKCGHAKLLSLLDGKDSKGKMLVPDTYKKPNNLCPDCNAVSHCKRLQDLANMELLKLLNRFHNSPAFDWKSGNNQSINSKKIIKKQILIPSDFGSLHYNHLFQDLTRNIQLKITVFDVSPLVDGINGEEEARDLKEKIKGAFYPESYDYPKTKIVGHHPFDPTRIVVLKWLVRKNKWNYAVIDRSYLDDNTKVDYSKIANEYKSTGECFERYGAATGYPPPPLDERYDPKRFSIATKGQPRLHFPSSQGYTTVYHSGNPRDPSRPIVGFTPRQDIIGQKFVPSRRRKLLMTKTNKTWRNVAIAKLQSRLRAMTIITHLGIDSTINSVWFRIQQACDEVAKPVTCQRWKQVDDSLTLIEIMFLEWACQSEETLNFVSVGCHDDGSGRDFETLMIGGLVQKDDNRNARAIVKGLENGLTILALQGLALKSIACETILHLMVDETSHLSDGSRNTGNFAGLTDYERKKLNAVANQFGIV